MWQQWSNRNVMKLRAYILCAKKTKITTLFNNSALPFQSLLHIHDSTTQVHSQKPQNIKKYIKNNSPNWPFYFDPFFRIIFIYSDYKLFPLSVKLIVCPTARHFLKTKRAISFGYCLQWYDRKRGSMWWFCIFTQNLHMYLHLSQVIIQHVVFILHVGPSSPFLFICTYPCSHISNVLAPSLT